MSAHMAVNQVGLLEYIRDDLGLQCPWQTTASTGKVQRCRLQTECTVNSHRACAVTRQFMPDCRLTFEESGMHT